MHFLKRGWIVIIGSISFVTISYAKQYSTDNIPAIQPVTELQLNTLPQHQCLYAGKGYSLGAIIAMDNLVLECRSAQEIELNGSLKWVVRQLPTVSVTPLGHK
ncbi:DUF1496 domain-containing protein [Photobacterium carnosum]|uniref:DUF1496 domain-containing protein n=1 Tax=Photobacterium carnosum TaxID=2023717 RepID=UPI00128DD844|nr:DUF1496 domain-containing protein [Photobacterium carnosum]KAE8177538.1 hypothetical protein CIT27_07365 [Photobacterium carnosum]MCD9498094.1 DUF1496 domain-containing protein [Photobacterium carnosum]MCD9550260.1 DUF1496 domain-containing protein [Photobacterium carnosum]MCD9552117.1 DUF1496 domain-containing protein [Photobacterium carnosum]MCD9555275.1 DUF1496 domain-containing protein [Photobacterium carnosum]